MKNALVVLLISLLSGSNLCAQAPLPFPADLNGVITKIISGVKNDFLAFRGKEITGLDYKSYESTIQPVGSFNCSISENPDLSGNIMWSCMYDVPDTRLKFAVATFNSWFQKIASGKVVLEGKSYPWNNQFNSDVTEAALREEEYAFSLLVLANPGSLSIKCKLSVLLSEFEGEKSVSIAIDIFREAGE